MIILVLDDDFENYSLRNEEGEEIEAPEGLLVGKLIIEDDDGNKADGFFLGRNMDATP